jgi:hypothetical protein
MWFDPRKNENIRTHPIANLANFANLHAQTNADSQNSQNSQRVDSHAKLKNPEGFELFETEQQSADDRHYCHECQNLRQGLCTKQKFRPVDDIPRRCIDFSQTAHQANKTFSDRDKASILAWLHYISENNQEIIDEVLDKCRSDPDALAYYLGRSREAPEAKPVQCQAGAMPRLHAFQKLYRQRRRGCLRYRRATKWHYALV